MKSWNLAVPLISLVLVAGTCGGCGYNREYEVVFTISDELGQPLEGEEIAILIPSPCDRIPPRGEHSFEDYSRNGSVMSTDTNGRIVLDVSGTTAFCLPSTDQLIRHENATVQCWVQFAFASVPDQHWLVAADPEVDHPQPLIENIKFIPAEADLGQESPSPFAIEGAVDFSSDQATLTISIQKRNNV